MCTHVIAEVDLGMSTRGNSKNNSSARRDIGFGRKRISSFSSVKSKNIDGRKWGWIKIDYRQKMTRITTLELLENYFRDFTHVQMHEIQIHFEVLVPRTKGIEPWQ